MGTCKMKENMNIVIVGHVDHGKSTIIGRLLHDTNSLPEGKLEAVKETCKRNSKPFEYAFLLDALKDEQAQGITIDAARVFFESPKRKYIIMDAPGHIEFLKNMVTGASRAESALLVIDAHEGIQENSKRHMYLLSMLGIRNVTVLVNKMDLVNYSKEVFNNTVKEYKEFLSELDIEAISYIPVSGFFGENIVDSSSEMSWYMGKPLLETLDVLESNVTDKPFRYEVQDVYKFTKNDDRRIVAGLTLSGHLQKDDTVYFAPSMKSSTVKSLEMFNSQKEELSRGDVAGFTLDEQIFISRGEVAYTDVKPLVSNRFKAKVFWLGKTPLVEKFSYILKIGTQRVNCKIEKINYVLNASTLEHSELNMAERHEVAELIISTAKEVAFDTSNIHDDTSRFILVDDYEISGGGIIVESLASHAETVKEMIKTRDEQWYKSALTSDERSKIYGHKPIIVLIVGEKGSGRKKLARFIEKQLVLLNINSYYLPIQNTIKGVDQDLLLKDDFTIREHVRRLSEVANILTQSGSVVIITLQSQNELYKEYFTKNVLTIDKVGKKTKVLNQVLKEIEIV